MVVVLMMLLLSWCSVCRYLPQLQARGPGHLISRTAHAMPGIASARYSQESAQCNATAW